MDNIITTTDLTKFYGKQRACEKINIHVKKGEIYGLIGRNGAGKTTILRIISGLSYATGGEYSINGKRGKELAAEKRQIGTLIEAPGLFPDMTAYENLKIKCIARNYNICKITIKLVIYNFKYFFKAVIKVYGFQIIWRYISVILLIAPIIIVTGL